MLKNYFKIAIAVLLRRKFFTFISLFGISFTLTIIILVTAFISHVTGAGYPDVNRGRELFVSKMHIINKKDRSAYNGGPSFYFINHYVSALKTQQKLAIFSNNASTNSYASKKKLVINLQYTNDAFWDVLQFTFVEGKPYNKQQLDNGEKVAVISEDTRTDYFGEDVQAVGKYIETDNVEYRVIGVVKSVPFTSNVYADMYAPYTVSKEDFHNTGLMGGYTGILLLNSAGDFDKMREEFNSMVDKLNINTQSGDHVYAFANTFIESFTRGLPFGEETDSGMTTFILIVAVIFLLFLLLPTLNLVNINISRIMERSSEIGVRKAFGASSKTLVYQFIIENLILTCIGGVVGVILSYVILAVVNSSNIIPHLALAINFKVLFVCLLACVVFGLLSGVYPAWRMSRLQVTAALKAQ